MGKMTPELLEQLQSLPLDIKIKKTEQRIREWYEYWEGQVFVSFSGGKDSTVLLDIARRIYPDIEAVFFDTGLEFPEVKEFVKTFDNVKIIRPKHSFKHILETYGYPVISKETADTIDGVRRYIKKNITGEYKPCPLETLQEYVDGVMGNELDDAHGGYSHPMKKLFSKGQFSRYDDGQQPWSNEEAEEHKKPDISTRTAKLLGMIDSNNNIAPRKKLRRNQKSKYSHEKYKFLINSDFKISEKCCYHMKKGPSLTYMTKTGKTPILATTTEESSLRKSAWLKTGCNSFTGQHRSSKPLSFWREQDILEYIDKYNLRTASIYGDLHQENGEYYFDGYDRTGCIFCLFGLQFDSDPNRIKRLKETHPKLYDYCLRGGQYNEDGWWVPSKDGLGMAHVLDFLNIDY